MHISQHWAEYNSFCKPDDHHDTDEDDDVGDDEGDDDDNEGL